MEKTKVEKTTGAIDVSVMIDKLAAQGNEALKAMADFDQEKVDHIVHF